MTASVAEDRYFPALNAIRAAAALGVVATHAAFDTGEVLQGAHGAFLARLDFGVTLFFVLSGFLLSRPLFAAAAADGRRPSYRHFLWKRALRILPLYWVAVVLALTVLPENRDLGGEEWFSHLTLTQIYTDGTLPPGLVQMWSLCTEVLYYVLLPSLVTVLLALRRGWAPERVMLGLAAMAAIGWTWQIAAGSGNLPFGPQAAQWLPGYLPWFAVGMCFAVVSVQTRYAPPASRWHALDRIGEDLTGCWLVGASLLVLACTPLAGPILIEQATPFQAGMKSVLYAGSAAAFVLPFVFGPETDGWVRRAASHRVAIWLGNVSYGIFCLHLLALEMSMRILGVEDFEGSFVSVFALTVATAVPMAAASYYVIERPALRLKNRGPFAAKAAPPMTSATTARK